MTAPLLDRAAIEARIPHAGAMVLIDAVEACDAAAIRCTTTTHRDPGHPLRLDGVLPAAAAVEYGAQAMAIHGALNAAAGEAASAGFLASLRGLILHAGRLDDAPAPLVIRAEQQAGDARQALYRFTLHDGAGRLLAEGRAAVVLQPGDAPGAAPGRGPGAGRGAGAAEPAPRTGPPA